MAEQGVFERSFDLDDPDLEAQMGAFCDMAVARIGGSGGTGAVAMKRLEGRTLTCVVIATGTPRSDQSLADYQARGFQQGDTLAVRNRPAPEASTGDMMRRVLEAQRRAAEGSAE